MLNVLAKGDEPGAVAQKMRYYEDIRPADFAADAADFDPDAIRVSGYYALPE